MGLLSVLAVGLGLAACASRRAGIAAAALLATNYIWVMWNRAALMETTMVAFIAISWSAYALAYRRPVWGAVAGASAILAFFTKAAAAFYVGALGLEVLLALACRGRAFGVGPSGSGAPASRARPRRPDPEGPTPTRGALDAGRTRGHRRPLPGVLRAAVLAGVQVLQLADVSDAEAHVRPACPRGPRIVAARDPRFLHTTVADHHRRARRLLRPSRPVAVRHRTRTAARTLGRARDARDDRPRRRQRAAVHLPHPGVRGAGGARARHATAVSCRKRSPRCRRARDGSRSRSFSTARTSSLVRIVRMPFLYDVRPSVRTSAAVAAVATLALYVWWKRLAPWLAQQSWSLAAALVMLAILVAGDLAQFGQWAAGRTYKNVTASRLVGAWLPPGTIVQGKLANGLALDNRIKPIFVGRGFGNYEDRLTQDRRALPLDVRHTLERIRRSSHHRRARRMPRMAYSENFRCRRNSRRARPRRAHSEAGQLPTRPEPECEGLTTAPSRRMQISASARSTTTRCSSTTGAPKSSRFWTPRAPASTAGCSTPAAVAAGCPVVCRGSRPGRRHRSRPTVQGRGNTSGRRTRHRESSIPAGRRSGPAVRGRSFDVVLSHAVIEHVADAAALPARVGAGFEAGRVDVSFDGAVSRSPVRIFHG